MAILLNEDGFYFFEAPNSDRIVIEDYRIAEYVDYINDKDIKSISIHLMKYNYNDLEFLRDCNGVRDVSILMNKEIDLSALYGMKNIITLHVDVPNAVIDFNQLISLESINITWHKEYENTLNSCILLRNVVLHKFNPLNKNIMILSNLTLLKELTIVRTNIISLEGIKMLRKLRVLNLFFASKLSRINEIVELDNSIEEIHIESCKNIMDLPVLSGMKATTILRLIKCGSIESLHFLKSLDKLKFLSFSGTKIVNGDLAYLTEMKHIEFIGFNNMRHYSHNSFEIRELITRKE